MMGSDIPRKSEARIIASTNADLGKLIEKGTFRKDLFYRLDTHSIHIPPLRNRLEDISILVEHFNPEPDFFCPPELTSILSTYNFLGNVRELRALILDSVRRSKLEGSLTEIIKGKLSLKLNPMEKQNIN